MKKNNMSVQRNISFSKKLDMDIQSHLDNFGFSSYAELVREAVREKVYGKNIRAKLVNKFLSEIEKEKDYLFKENKNMYKKLLQIANDF